MSAEQEGREAGRLTPDMARAAIEFMNRSTLHATEIEAFLHIRVTLEMIARGADRGSSE